MQPRVAIPLTLSAPRRTPGRGPLLRLGGTTMGTTWSVQCIAAAGLEQPLHRAIAAELDRVVAQMSPWEPRSDISRFNCGAIGEWQTLPAEFAKVIDCALRVAQETDGAYDPCMGALVDLWGFGPSARRMSPPAREAIEQALDHSGWRHLAFDPQQARLRRTAAAQLDLCGIAKGFAVDQVMAALRRHGVDHALVEIGGELAGCGVKPDRTPWWVAIDRPAGERIATAPLLVALHGLAIATSGCERGFADAGRVYSHTIDPATGAPIDNAMVSASVLHLSCIKADAYATALMVLGPEAGLAFAARHNLAAALLFKSGGSLAEKLSPALQAMLD
ncbi:thiamine biosynthesis lipoprotein [Rhodopseudomonas rhenobacensis]|uniref:FAD:protein FMN transferase n=1 Tax=Rhodopseudomonas rhenobacensis TaxID=87461 RepID=A0A7W7Z7P5_9BRAD|nr:FAD:protein FMN transferase [Rhodopseudomonas rhenobacensis]MBB5049541.1 thiamine biosynthesis lipoprotein [Rhodopseudomonas rhenobacensis]